MALPLIKIARKGINKDKTPQVHSYLILFLGCPSQMLSVLFRSLVIIIGPMGLISYVILTYETATATQS